MALPTFFINFNRFLAEFHVKTMEKHIVGFHTPPRK